MRATRLIQACFSLTGCLIFPVSLHAQTVNDADGNVYQTVTIGTQEWMTENLKTTRFNDGSGIPLIEDSSSWGNAGIPGYCWFSNTPVYKDVFGALYNWQAVTSGKLAPTGWHVPTDGDWSVLADFLGGDSVAGGKLKSVGTVEIGTGYWFTPNVGATDQSGFSARAGGARELDGSFHYRYSHGYWWTSTSGAPGFAVYRQLSYNYQDIYRGYLNIQDGLSVRCVKDTEPGIDAQDPLKTIRIFFNSLDNRMVVESKGTRISDLAVFNLMGEAVLQVKTVPQRYEADLGSLPKGIYVLQLNGPQGRLHRKFAR